MSDTDWLKDALEPLYAYDQAGGYVPLELADDDFKALGAAIEQKLEWEKQEAVKNAFQAHQKQYPDCPQPLQATKENLG